MERLIMPDFIRRAMEAKGLDAAAIDAAEAEAARLTESTPPVALPVEQEVVQEELLS